MGQTLENSIYLPDEGETNCYSGLASNWRALDTLKGSYSLHAINVDIHVTAAEKETWNGKADASALTAHTGDTTIHVTSADKQTWNNHVADTVKHVTAEDKARWDAVTSKADDLDVVHKSGNETKSGELTLLDKLNSSDIIPKANLTYNLGNSDYKFLNIYSYMLNAIGRYLGNEASTNQRTDITLYANRDTQNQSCAYITRFRPNRAQGALQHTDIQKIGFDVLENGVRTNNVFDIQCTDWLNDVPQRVNFVSSAQSYSWGRSINKSLFNDLNPGALSLPSGNANDVIDISSYITALDGTDNSYTPPADGWLCISGKNCTKVYVYRNYYWGVNSISATGENLRIMIPVVSGKAFQIQISGAGLNYACFIPCQGNV